MSSSGFWPGPRGRPDECDTLGRLVASAQAGRSQVVVLRRRGRDKQDRLARSPWLTTPGAARLAARRVSESELELAYFGLHQLCSPYPDRIGTLPAPQRAALGTAFGLQPGRAPRAITTDFFT